MTCELRSLVVADTPDFPSAQETRVRGTGGSIGYTN